MADLQRELHSGKFGEGVGKLLPLLIFLLLHVGTTLSVPHDPPHRGSNARRSGYFHPALEAALQLGVV